MKKYLLALAVVAGLSAPAIAEDVGRANDYCSSHYRSYDPETGTYLGYDGVRHPCPKAQPAAVPAHPVPLPRARPEAPACTPQVVEVPGPERVVEVPAPAKSLWDAHVDLFAWLWLLLRGLIIGAALVASVRFLRNVYAGFIAARIPSTTSPKAN